MKFLVLSAALALPTVATAHDPLVFPDYAPRTYWLDAPHTTSGPGEARIRIVQRGAGKVAALTPNQLWLYQNTYRLRLARLAMHMPLSHAMPRARQAAIHAVIGRYPEMSHDSFEKVPLDGGRLLPGG